MAPPTNKPVLEKLDATNVAREVVDAVREHIARLTFGLAPGCEWHEHGGFNPHAGETRDDGAKEPAFLPPRPHESTLWATTEDLVRYAQSGDTADWGDATGAHDAALTICSALYSSAAVSGDGLGELVGEADPETPIGLVLVAAIARAALDGAPTPDRDPAGLTVRELAALASLSAKQVKELIDAGEIRATNDGARKTRIALGDARRWLSGRGVPGFAR